MTIKGTMLAVDPSLSGGDDSVVVATGMQDGCVVIVGITFLKETSTKPCRSWWNWPSVITP